MGKTSKYYAVRRGRNTGVFTSWDDVKPLVDHFAQAKHKSFATQAEAEQWLLEDGWVPPPSANAQLAPPQQQPQQRAPKRARQDDEVGDWGGQAGPSRQATAAGGSSGALRAAAAYHAAASARSTHQPGPQQQQQQQQQQAALHRAPAAPQQRHVSSAAGSWGHQGARTAGPALLTAPAEAGQAQLPAYPLVQLPNTFAGYAASDYGDGRRAAANFQPFVQRNRFDDEPWGGHAAAYQGRSQHVRIDGPLARVSGNLLYRLEFDGASRGNPGAAGCGAVLVEDGTNTKVGCLRYYMGNDKTNNEAEYTALIEGLKMAAGFGVRRVRAQGDSKLVVCQVQGLWQVNAEHLRPLHSKACDASDSFELFEIKHVRREFNTAADVLSNEAIDLA